MLDKLLSNTYKMYQMYQTVKSQLDLEQDTDETSKNRFTTEI